MAILRTIFSISSQKLQFWIDCTESLHQLGEIYSNEASDTWIRHSPFFICLLSSLLAMFYSFYCTGISHVLSDLLPSLSYLKKKFCCRCFHFNFWLIVYNIWKCNWLLYIDLVCFNLPKLTKYSSSLFLVEFIRFFYIDHVIYEYCFTFSFPNWTSYFILLILFYI